MHVTGRNFKLIFLGLHFLLDCIVPWRCFALTVQLHKEHTINLGRCFHCYTHILQCFPSMRRELNEWIRFPQSSKRATQSNTSKRRELCKGSKSALHKTYVRIGSNSFDLCLTLLWVSVIVSALSYHWPWQMTMPFHHPVVSTSLPWA